MRAETPQSSANLRSVLGPDIWDRRCLVSKAVNGLTGTLRVGRRLNRVRGPRSYQRRVPNGGTKQAGKNLPVKHIPAQQADGVPGLVGLFAVAEPGAGVIPAGGRADRHPAPAGGDVVRVSRLAALLAEGNA